MTKKLTTPTILAFERSMEPSEAVFFETLWSEKELNHKPLKIEEKTVRGTKSNRAKSSDLKNDTAAEKFKKTCGEANLQTVDNCSLSSDKDTLVTQLSLKVFGKFHTPHACNDFDFGKALSQKVKGYIDEVGLSEIASRYAQNIANARYLWGNRVGADEIIVNVVSAKTSKVIEFDAFDYGLNDFDQEGCPKLEQLTCEIESALKGDSPFALFYITVYAKLGFGQLVRPSQELILDKKKEGDGVKSKVLYHKDGVAALHSQKVGNALRTIDVEYPKELDGEGIGAIAIEPYGSVTTLGYAFRDPKTKVDFYSLFDKFINGEELSEDNQMFVIANLIRGGVLGCKD